MSLQSKPRICNQVTFSAPRNNNNNNNMHRATFVNICYQCVFFATLVMSASIQRKEKSKTVVCNELSEHLLSDILGPAFNSRYMSIGEPMVSDRLSEADQDNHSKRKVGLVPPFYVEDDYAREIADEPAWSVNHVETLPPVENDRRKRSISSGKGVRQWECESRITWIDLGPDYFPRYLRSVECTSKTCWYGHYKCKPRSFTVKILRRKTGRCTVAKAGSKIGIYGLPSELRELWVWEERAVNFCCDCAL